MAKQNGYAFVKRFEEVMVEHHKLPMSQIFPKVKKWDTWKRVAGFQYKKFCLKDGCSEREFAWSIRYLSRRGMILSGENISKALEKYNNKFGE